MEYYVWVPKVVLAMGEHTVMLGWYILFVVVV
jgi:hypothetical protein